MKTTRLLSFMAAAIAAFTVHADTETVDGYTWTYTLKVDEGVLNGVEICRSYDPETGSYVPPTSPAPTGAVTIPSSLGGLPVTSIGARAFFGCSELTSVTIPSSVTSIGDRAFSECWGLTDAEGFIVVRGVLYGYGGSSHEVTIPDGVTRIETGAFDGRSDITNVTIPASVTSIGASAFSGCSGLTSVTIPDSVTSSAEHMFSECWGLVDAEGFIVVQGVLYGYAGSSPDVTIPDGVTRIDTGVFDGRSDITSVTIPDSVTDIGALAFKGCDALTSVTMGNGVKSIGESAFSYCWTLKEISIPSSVTNIGDAAFHECVGLTSVVIPDSVVNIGSGAFEECSGLTSVRLPESLTEMAGMVFESCISLTEVTIPDAVTVIGGNAFSHCKALTNVTIGRGIHKIYYGAFDDCPVLTSVKYLGNAHEIGTSDGSWTWGDTVTDCVVYAPVGATGFDTDEDDKWHGRKVIRYEPGTAPVPENPTPDYEVLDAKDIVAPYAAPKAVVLQGVAYNGGDVVGIVELKLGKVNAKKKTSKVSGSFTSLDGKILKFKAVNVTGIDGSAPATVSFNVKGRGQMTVTIGGTQFAGSLGGWHVQSGVVGGNWTRAGAKVQVAATSAALPQGTIEELWPTGEPVIPKSGKWAFAKASTVKYAKDKKTKALTLVISDKNGTATNGSAMKLAYTPKKGTFKGSFKVYAIQNGKLKKFSAKVTGVVAGGTGYGIATLAKFGTFKVSVE